MPSKKSVIVAYILWLFSGIFGVHHFYLRRDRHAFVWWSTLGGFGVGWLGEVFRIPRYVRDANEDPKYMQELIARMRQNKKVFNTIFYIFSLAPSNQRLCNTLGKLSKLFLFKGCVEILSFIYFILKDFVVTTSHTKCVKPIQ